MLEKVPKQPTHEELNSDPYLFRFGMVFDREGYSPVFFKEMWGKRIACYTYQKYVHEDWPTTEFKETQVIFPNGEVSSIKLAERGVFFQKQKLWVRQICKLTESSHQTALVTTDCHTDAAQVAGAMFSRWPQENFFKYMMEHYGIDRLIDYQVEKMDETIRVLNPRYKEVETQVRSKSAKLSRKRAEYGALILEGEIKVKIHNMTNPRNNQYVKKLCKILNESETVFPGTQLRLVYDLVSNQNPADQDF